MTEKKKRAPKRTPLELVCDHLPEFNVEKLDQVAAALVAKSPKQARLLGEALVEAMEKHEQAEEEAMLILKEGYIAPQGEAHISGIPGAPPNPGLRHLTGPVGDVALGEPGEDA